MIRKNHIFLLYFMLLNLLCRTPRSLELIFLYLFFIHNNVFRWKEKKHKKKKTRQEKNHHLCNSGSFDIWCEYLFLCLYLFWCAVSWKFVLFGYSWQRSPQSLMHSFPYSLFIFSWSLLSLSNFNLQVLILDAPEPRCVRLFIVHSVWKSNNGCTVLFFGQQEHSEGSVMKEIKSFILPFFIFPNVLRQSNLDFF